MTALQERVRRALADAFVTPDDERRGPDRRALAFDAAVVGVLLLMTVGSAHHHLHESAGGVAAGVVMALALLARRRWPVPVFAVVAVAALAQWLLGVSARPQDFAVLVSLYTVAAYEGRRWSLPALAVGLVGSGLVWVLLDSSVRTAPRLVAIGLMTLAAWAVGDNVGTRRAYLRSVEERAARLERERDAQARAAVAEERARIAREMHDVVAHRVGVIIAQADGAAAAFVSRPGDARRALDVIAETGRGALAELRRLLGVLRDDAAATVEPQPGLAGLDRLLADVGRSGLSVSVEVAGDVAKVDDDVGLAAYRIVQEGLTNVLKHAGPSAPTTVRVAVSSTEVVVLVENDASTPVPRSARSTDGTGHGLVGMRERVALFGGRLHAGPSARGWRVEAVIPLSPLEEAR